MTTYEVSYRAPGTKRWTTISGVVGDGIDTTFGFRFIKCENEELWHIPLIMEVRFSSKRAANIRSKMSDSTGQEVR